MKPAHICDWCHEQPADDRYEEIIGIASKSAGSTGGRNLLIGRKRTGRAPCADCFRKLRDGVPIGQMDLFR